MRKTERIKEIMQEYADNQAECNLANMVTEVIEIAQSECPRQSAIKLVEKALAIKTCDFCGYQGTDVVLEDYYDIIAQHDTSRYGCRDKQACLQRQDQADKEWRQAMGKRQLTEAKE